MLSGDFRWFHALSHWGLVTHICVVELGHHWFRQWLVACSVPSHYLNQCWNIVNWTVRNKLHWNFNRNSNIFIQEIAFENVVCKMASILYRPQWVIVLLVFFYQCVCLLLVLIVSSETHKSTSKKPSIGTMLTTNQHVQQLVVFSVPPATTNLAQCNSWFPMHCVDALRWNIRQLYVTKLCFQQNYRPKRLSSRNVKRTHYDATHCQMSLVDIMASMDLTPILPPDCDI